MTSNDDILDVPITQGRVFESCHNHSYQQKTATELAALWPIICNVQWQLKALPEHGIFHGIIIWQEYNLLKTK